MIATNSSALTTALQCEASRSVVRRCATSGDGGGVDGERTYPWGNEPEPLRESPEPAPPRDVSLTRRERYDR